MTNTVKYLFVVILLSNTIVYANGICIPNAAFCLDYICFRHEIKSFLTLWVKAWLCFSCEIDCEALCVSGDMHIRDRARGIVKVSQLAEGDMIQGVMGVQKESSWCKVEAIFQAANGKNKTTYDGFTLSHMIVDKNVHMHGPTGDVHHGPVFTLATDCDAAVNSDGQIFTPISTTFCPQELSWDDYLSLIAAIRNITSKTGNFWYNLASYQDNDTSTGPRWLNQLPTLCTELLRCSRKGECETFENVTKRFVHDHLRREFVVVVERSFPNLGGDVAKSESGTISEVVRTKRAPQEDKVLISTIGGSLAVVLIIVALVIATYHYREKRKRLCKGKKQDQDTENLALIIPRD